MTSSRVGPDESIAPCRFQQHGVKAAAGALLPRAPIFVTKSVIEDPKTAKILQSSGLQPTMRRAALRGIADETTVYEIP
jgi:hypothetical protein